MNEDTFEKPFIGHSGGGLYNLDDMNTDILTTKTDIETIQGKLENIDPSNPTREFVTVYENEIYGYNDTGLFNLNYVRSEDIFSFWGNFTIPATSTSGNEYYDFSVDVLDMYQGDPLGVLAFSNDPFDSWGVVYVQFFTGFIRFYPFTWSYEPGATFEFDKVLVLWEVDE